MTAAQKTAKANFKKAIEYRKKTGVSLKEAFAHVYGKKKVGAAPKKKATKKKAAPKKAAKKVVKKAAPKKVGYSKIRLKQEKGITNVLRSTPKTKFYTEEEKIIKAGKRYFDKKDRELVTKGVYGIKKKAAKKRKPIKEQSILNKIHKVKNQVNQLDELQHKHMMGSVAKHTIDELNKAISKYYQYKEIIDNINKDLKEKPNMPSYQKKELRDTKKTFNSLMKEQKTHIAQLKKHIK